MNTNADKLTEKHRGEVLEIIIRKSPCSIKTLANKLGISRTTLYNKFKEYNLDYDFLLQVSNILYCDIQEEIPQLNTQITLPVNQYGQQNRLVEKQYIELLERYKRLFIFLTRVTHKYGLKRVRHQIDRIIDKERISH